EGTAVLVTHCTTARVASKASGENRAGQGNAAIAASAWSSVSQLAPATKAPVAPPMTAGASRRSTIAAANVILCSSPFSAIVVGDMRPSETAPASMVLEPDLSSRKYTATSRLDSRSGGTPTLFEYNVP